MSDALGLISLTSANSQVNPKYLDPENPGGFLALMSIKNETPDGSVLARSASNARWTVIPPYATVQIGVLDGDGLALATPGPRYRSLNVGKGETPNEVPYRLIVSQVGLIVAAATGEGSTDDWGAASTPATLTADYGNIADVDSTDDWGTVS